MSAKVRTQDIVGKSRDDLLKQLDELKHELHDLRVQQAAGTGRLGRIVNVRKNIARVLTVINLNARAEVRAKYAKKPQHLPIDLRPKKTRAIRRQLTKHEASLKTPRQAKREAHLKPRLYVVKA